MKKRTVLKPVSELERVTKELNWSKRRLAAAQTSTNDVRSHITLLTLNDYTTLEAKLRKAESVLAEALSLWDKTASDIRASLKKELDNGKE